MALSAARCSGRQRSAPSSSAGRASRGLRLAPERWDARSGPRAEPTASRVQQPASNWERGDGQRDPVWPWPSRPSGEAAARSVGVGSLRSHARGRGRRHAERSSVVCLDAGRWRGSGGGGSCCCTAMRSGSGSADADRAAAEGCVTRRLRRATIGNYERNCVKCGTTPPLRHAPPSSAQCLEFSGKSRALMGQGTSVRRRCHAPTETCNRATLHRKEGRF